MNQSKPHAQDTMRRDLDAAIRRNLLWQGGYFSRHEVVGVLASVVSLSSSGMMPACKAAGRPENNAASNRRLPSISCPILTRPFNHIIQDAAGQIMLDVAPLPLNGRERWTIS
jgi:hypothetical protein